MQLPFRRRSLAGFDQEMILELGLVLFAAGLATGLGALVLGRTTGKARHSYGRSQKAPAAGSVSPGRHGNVSTVAAR